MASSDETRTSGDAPLRALFLNCTLKRSPRESNTDALIEMSRRIMHPRGVTVEALRPVDYAVATGMMGDMTEDGWDRDDWPRIYRKVLDADILVLCSPIWLGEKSSVCTRVIERLNANSSEQNEKGQYIYYGRVAGCLITGNEDGAKHCAQSILFSLSTMGFTIPPQVNAGWIGQAGPGPSYRDEGSGGPENDFTNRSVAAMTWNLMHVARMLKERGGLPSEGNDNAAWEKGERFGLPEPGAIRELKGGPSQREAPVGEPAMERSAQ